MDKVDYKTLFESVPGLYIILSPDFTIITANDSYCKATMTKCEEIAGRNLFEVFPDNPDDPDADGVSNLRISLNSVLKNKASNTMAVQKYDVRKSDGTFEERYWSPLNTPVINSANEVIYIIHRVEDVTAFMKIKNEQIKNDELTEALLTKVEAMEADIFLRAKEIQALNANLEKKVFERTEELSKNEKLFRSLVENNESIIALLDENLKTVYRSPSSERITGYTSEERKVVGTTELTHPEDAENAKNIMADVLKNPGIPIKIFLRTKHKNGHYISLNGTITNLLHEPTVKGIVTNFRDVTARKNAEDLLKETGALAKVGGWELNLTNMTVKWTEEVYRIHEVDPGIIPPINEAINFYAPEARSTILSAVEKCISTGQEYDLELPFITAKGKHLWVRTIGKAEFDGGKVIRVYGVFQDITTQKEAKDEIQKLNEELEQKVIERTAQLESAMKELEAFSYTVSHDLRAPLRAISGYAKILEEDFGNQLGDEGKRRIDIIKSNAKNMGLLIDDLLSFSRLGRKEIQKKTLDIKRIVEDVVSEIDKDVYKNTEIIIGTLHPANADASLLKQVFVNLVSNAVKYSSKKEHALVEISSKEEDDKIIYMVKDNGAGFDMAYVHKIFGIFERLHSIDEFEGTGVGLAIVQRIINRHGGEIWAIGKEGIGAEFYFTLPKR